MGLTNDRRYSAVAVVLHWAIATFILFNLVSGSFMESLHGGLRHFVITCHISSGLTVLMLSIARIGWRLTHRPPPLDAMLSPLERAGAHVAHALLYFLMIAMPLTGWAISSASTRAGVQSMLYFLAPLPKIGFLASLPMAEKIAAHDRASVTHWLGAWTLLVLLIAHVLGALKHQFADHRPQFARMWFGR